MTKESELVYGVGVHDSGRFPSCVKQEKTKHYRLWSSMLERCYHKRERTTRSGYRGCSVSENFKSFQYFAEWCEGQVGFDVDGFHLDKDITLKGNKQYHEDLCVFIPHQINTCLTNRQVKRGEYPIGVSYHRPLSKFRAQILENGVKRHLGYFDDAQCAYLAYKSAKELWIRGLAEKYKECISERAYVALLNWEVNIND